jgi:hypothetical protein
VALFNGELGFPLDALRQIQTFAESLSERCRVPVCVPATTCLALAPQIAGTRVKIDPGYGLPLGCNLYFGVGVDRNAQFRAAVESVLRPVHRLREDLIGPAKGDGGTGHFSLLTKCRLEQNRGRSVPLLLSSSTPSAGWDRLLQSSWDGVLFHYSCDGDILLELLDYAEKGKRHPAAKVLKSAYAQELVPFNSLGKGDAMKLQAQSLGLLWFCGRDVPGRFATSRPWLEDGLSACFVMFDSEAEAEALNGAILQPTEGEGHWEQTIRGLFEWRLSAEEQVFRVCDEGAQQLGLFANFVRSCISAEDALVPSWAERAWRLTLLLHVLDGGRYAVIGVETVWNAIRLAAWYLGQVRLLPNRE